MSRSIALTQYQFAIVDDADFDVLNRWKWFAHWNQRTNSFYAQRMSRLDGKRIVLHMHREILGLPNYEPRQVDHRNQDTLDNQRTNLRVCTQSENRRNSKTYKCNSSGYRGVRMRPNGKWEARIQVNGKAIYLGLFGTQEQAVRGYENASHEFHGEFSAAASK